MTNLGAGGVLLVFTKPPVSGQVKTRLIPGIGRRRALSLYEELLTKTLNTARQAGFSSLQLWVHGDLNHPYFNRLKNRHAVKLFKQKGKNLGQRMSNAFITALSRYPYAVLIGCDCPSLECSDLKTASAYLNKKTDIVLGPAIDGGYYLIGLTKNNAQLFSGIQWGKDKVFIDTCANISRLNWKLDLLPMRWDVDRTADLLAYFKLKRNGSVLYY